MSEEPDPQVGSELRQTAGRQWAEEAAEDERLTELLRRRRLSLADVARDLEHRGARVAVEFAGHSFSGPLAGVGEDFATIEAPGQLIDIRYPVTMWAVLPAGNPIERAPAEPRSFRAHLHELAESQGRVGLALPDGDIAIGTLDVIATDHVELHDADNRVLLVPLDLVLATIRSIDPH